MSARVVALALTCLPLVTGCQQTRVETSLRVVVTFDPSAREIDQFRFAGYHAADESMAFAPGELPPHAGAPFTEGTLSGLVLLADELVGQELLIRVWGLRNGEVVAFGRARVIPELGVTREVTVEIGDAVQCGDGAVHPTEETCDTGIDPGMEGACPVDLGDCDDTDQCTADRVEGASSCLARCFNDPITTCSHGDGCCPAGCGPASDSDCSAVCGDGLVGAGETCDTGIVPGEPGSCPTSCAPDGNPCTDDGLTSGGSCQAECAYHPITGFFGGDLCCPPGGDATLDSDCAPICGNGVLEPGESCDVAISSGAPGACPTDCEDGDACTEDTLFDGATCDARCVRVSKTLFVDGDGCCPVGGNNNIDDDCSVTCGNGALESGELCDTGLAAGAPGACPTSCDDAVPCTTDTLTGGSTCQAACGHVDITGCGHGDGCCPAGCGPSTDNDCQAACGDGVVGTGELCDTGITAGLPGACPGVVDCDDGNLCTVESVAGAGSCQAQCVNEPVGCADGDGCCSAQCNATTDNDCSAICGNSVVEPGGGELCDTGIGAGLPGACPTGCDDGEVCTDDVLLAAGTCTAQCDFVPITAFVGGDGCCPLGGNNNVDGDCPATCGNGAVETGETCDTAIPGGDAGSCATDCDDSLDCTADILINPGSCLADCVNNPVTACVDGDGCCPAGCSLANDDDCSVVCGDGAVNGSELCDTAIALGQPGACPTLADCDDTDSCTEDSVVGDGSCQAHCENELNGCDDDDGCCPSGCTNNTDNDCAALCGNGLVEPGGGELCDTAIAAGQPGACPSAQDCDDSDPCTADSLEQAGTCQAACVNPSITSCGAGEGCCPAGCDAGNDPDCGGCGNGLHEPSFGETCDDGNSNNLDGCTTSCTDMALGKHGAPCNVNSDCHNSYDCYDQTSYGLTGGYCSAEGCSPGSACDGNKGVCVASFGGYSGSGLCVQRCTVDTQCRWAEGYTCQAVGGGYTACSP